MIYILKENRTYDQILGDLPQGNGDPSLCIFPEKVTPNHHALAREFVLLDNFYVESEVSADGHEWSMVAYATDFVERTWPLLYRGSREGKLRYPAEGSLPVAQPSSGYIWDRCRAAGITYRSYGEFIDLGKTPDAPFTTKIEALKDHFDPGYRPYDLADEVLVVEPCFVANAAAVEMASGIPVMVATSVEHDFQVTGAELEAHITPRTKAILLSYPINPTGAILTREHILQVAAVAEKYDLVVISDEIYERLIYGAEHINFATLPHMFERTIVLSGMSKAYALTGWRIGYATAPEPLLNAMKKLHQYLIMSAPTMGQMAAIEALNKGEDDVEAMRQSYDARRRLIVDAFKQIGLTCFEPRGAFYAFPSVEAVLLPRRCVLVGVELLDEA